MAFTLELRGVSKRFGTQTVVDNLSIALREGEFFSLLGPSGCGKSTTLAMVAGFVEPDSGEIRISGKDVRGVPAQQRGIGFVFQDFAVFTKLTVRANLEFGLAAKRVPRAQRSALVEAVAQKLDIRGILERRGGALNMSEMQRVAMARVLIMNPEILLLDEPMSNLDTDIRASLRGELMLLQRMHSQTVFYVTHDQVEALSMSDRIGIMREGKLVQVGSPEEVYRNPVNRFVAEFIGEPQINVLPCEVRREAASLRVDTASHAVVLWDSGEVEAGRHYLGVRPHDIRLSSDARPGSAPATVRFVENLGSEHVLHLTYGQELLRVVVQPGIAAVDDIVYVTFDLRRVLLIDGTNERVVVARTAQALA